MNFINDHCRQGASITLRTEMDILLVVSNTPNPLNPAGIYPSVPVQIEMAPAEPVSTLQDYCAHFGRRIAGHLRIHGSITHYLACESCN